MEPDILPQLMEINQSIMELTATIKVIGGILFGSLLFIHFGRFMRW